MTHKPASVYKLGYKENITSSGTGGVTNAPFPISIIFIKLHLTIMPNNRFVQLQPSPPSPAREILDQIIDRYLRKTSAWHVDSMIRDKMI